MRPPREWMNKATEPVLEVLRRSEWPLPAKTLDYVIRNELNLDDPPSRPTIYRALEILETRGWIEDVAQKGSAHYRLTDDARDWMESSLE